MFAFTIFAVIAGTITLGYASSIPTGTTESLDSQGKTNVCLSRRVTLAKGAAHSAKSIYADAGIYRFTNCQDTVMNAPVAPVEHQRNFASFDF
jgi:hypothetical protein